MDKPAKELQVERRRLLADVEYGQAGLRAFDLLSDPILEILLLPAPGSPSEATPRLPLGRSENAVSQALSGASGSRAWVSSTRTGRA